MLLRDIHYKFITKYDCKEVIKSRCHHCGDIDLAGYLVNEVGPVPLVLDLRIAHDRFGVQLAQTDRGQFHFRPNPPHGCFCPVQKQG